jgi:hypothetical protein
MAYRGTTQRGHLALKKTSIDNTQAISLKPEISGAQPVACREPDAETGALGSLRKNDAA